MWADLRLLCPLMGNVACRVTPSRTMQMHCTFRVLQTNPTCIQCESNSDQSNRTPVTVILTKQKTPNTQRGTFLPPTLRVSTERIFLVFTFLQMWRRADGSCSQCWFSGLKMEAVCSFGTLESACKSTRKTIKSHSLLSNGFRYIFYSTKRWMKLEK